MTVALGIKIGNDILRVINGNAKFPMANCWFTYTRDPDRRKFWPIFQTMRATHAERVKHQCPRESPTGEAKSVTLVGWNHHNDPAMKASNQPGGSLQLDGEFLEERMTEHGRLHDLFQERVASNTPYTTKELLKDARKLLELDLILLVGSDLTWNKTERGVAPRTDASQTSALIRPPQPASGGRVNSDEDGDEDSEDNDDDNDQDY